MRSLAVNAMGRVGTGRVGGSGGAVRAGGVGGFTVLGGVTKSLAFVASAGWWDILPNAVAGKPERDG